MMKLSVHQPLHPLQPVRDEMNGADVSVSLGTDDDNDEVQDDDAASQTSGAEELLLEAPGALAFRLRAGLHGALYIHQVCCFHVSTLRMSSCAHVHIAWGCMHWHKPIRTACKCMVLHPREP
jgi:hypothetical protein